MYVDVNDVVLKAKFQMTTIFSESVILINSPLVRQNSNIKGQKW